MSQSIGVLRCTCIRIFDHRVQTEAWLEETSLCTLCHEERRQAQYCLVHACQCVMFVCVCQCVCVCVPSITDMCKQKEASQN
jgi:hypothetical protein